MRYKLTVKMLVLYRTLNSRWCLISLHCSSIKNTFCKAVILGENLKRKLWNPLFVIFSSSFVNLQSPSCLQLQLRVTSKKSMNPNSSPATLTTTWGNWLLVVFSCCCTVCSFVTLDCIFKKQAVENAGAALQRDKIKKTNQNKTKTQSCC